MRTLLGAGWRFVLLLVVAVAFIVAPLFVVYRSSCMEDGQRVDDWALVAPWDDPPDDCTDHQNGFEVLKDELGL